MSRWIQHDPTLSLKHNHDRSSRIIWFDILYHQIYLKMSFSRVIDIQSCSTHGSSLKQRFRFGSSRVGSLESNVARLRWVNSWWIVIVPQPPKFQKEGLGPKYSSPQNPTKIRKWWDFGAVPVVGFKTCLSQNAVPLLIFPTWPDLPVLLWMLPQIFGRLRLRATPETLERFSRTREKGEVFQENESLGIQWSKRN